MSKNIKRYSRPINVGRTVIEKESNIDENGFRYTTQKLRNNTRQKGVVQGLLAGGVLYLSWTLCDNNDKFNKEFGISTANGRLASMTGQKHCYYFEVDKAPSWAELMVNGVPRTAIPTLISLALNVIQHNPNAVVGIAIYTEKKVSDVSKIIGNLKTLSRKVPHLNEDKVFEAIW